MDSTCLVIQENILVSTISGNARPGLRPSFVVENESGPNVIVECLKDSWNSF